MCVPKTSCSTTEVLGLRLAAGLEMYFPLMALRALPLVRLTGIFFFTCTFKVCLINVIITNFLDSNKKANGC